MYRIPKIYHEFRFNTVTTKFISCILIFIYLLIVTSKFIFYTLDTYSIAIDVAYIMLITKMLQGLV